MKTTLLVAALLLPAAAPAQERTVVPLEPAEREHVLAEMRDFLGMMERINGALAAGDFDAIAAAARPLGTGGDKGRMPPAIMKKLPQGFRLMARSAHEQVDAIAADAARRDARHTLEQTSRLLATCNGCHAAWRFPAD
jgi:cytochrome c556